MRLDDEIVMLYRESRRAYQEGDLQSATRFYRQLRKDHCIELFYEIDLPENIKMVHPIGTVLGRATYADYLVVYQGCSVGSTVDMERPTFTGPCVMFPHSGVIGPVTMGQNVWITAGTIVEAAPGKPINIPDNMLVYHRADNTWGFRHTKRSVIEQFFEKKS